MNLAESEKWKAPAKGRRCIVCGEACARYRNGPWLMSLAAGAKEYGLTIKSPEATSFHDACGDRLQFLIQQKRARAKVSNNEKSDFHNAPSRQS